MQIYVHTYLYKYISYIHIHKHLHIYIYMDGKVPAGVQAPMGRPFAQLCHTALPMHSMSCLPEGPLPSSTGKVSLAAQRRTDVHPAYP